MTERAAIWVRVSTEDQHLENQVTALRDFAERRDFEVVAEYRVEESAFTGRHNKHLAKVRDAGRRGEFDVLLVTALDRLSRQGPLAILQLVKDLSRVGVRVVSLREPFTDLPDGLEDMFIAVAGWVAQYYSVTLSVNTKRGMAGAASRGVKLGRPKGSTDKRPRRRAGYYRRYAE